MKLGQLLDAINREGSNTDYIQICGNDDWDSWDSIYLKSKILIALRSKTVLALRAYDKTIRVIIDWE